MPSGSGQSLHGKRYGIGGAVITSDEQELEGISRGIIIRAVNTCIDSPNPLQKLADDHFVNVSMLSMTLLHSSLSHSLLSLSFFKEF
jgi:hypothetical protein